MPSVLLVSEDPAAQELGQQALSAAGYRVLTAANANQAIRSLFTLRIDAAVIDCALADDLDWLCQRLRNIGGFGPIVFLAPAGARWATGGLPLDERWDGLVVKPFSPDDVVRAVQQALVAARRSSTALVLFGELRLDRPAQVLKGDKHDVQLTPTEFRLIEYLAQRRGAITSSEELLQKVWNFYPGTGSSDLVRSHMRNLRAKLRLASPGRELIQTIPRRGYRLAVSGEQPAPI